MTYKMFIDDERFPVDGDDSIICRGMYGFKWITDRYGFPYYISFDHDLGDGPTGYDIAKYIVSCDLDGGVLPEDFSFYVHSQNPIGKANIEGLLMNYLEKGMT